MPPRNLWQNSRESISHYYRWIWEYLAYLPLLCDARRESRVLELGCGHGRLAHGLLHYLRHPGYYRGLDVDREQIEAAQERIQRLSPAFQFVWADVYNRQTNPSGCLKAESFVFPFETGTFDVVFAASLFSHLLPDETRNYFLESRRILVSGGKCLFSFFVLDYYRGKGTSVSPLYEFEHAFPGHTGVAVRDREHPDVLVGYSLERISEYAKQAGLTGDLAAAWS